jgi:thymidylate synthase ThyX
MKITYYSDIKQIVDNIHNAIEMVRHPEKIPSEILESFKIKKINKVAMTLGHESVLEHGLISFTIHGISRLALEFLEHHRLASYTETSFRSHQNELHIFQPSGMALSDLKEIEKNISEVYNLLIFRQMAPEDARMILPCSILSSVFVSVNVREALKMASRFAYSAFPEVQTLGVSLIEYLKNIFGSVQMGVFLSNGKQVENWTPWAQLDFPPKTNDFFMSKIPCSDAISLMGIKEPADRLQELQLYFIRGFLSTAAVAQLRRHRMASLFVSYPDAFKVDILPLCSCGNTELVERILQLVAKYSEVLGEYYSAPLGRARRIVFAANRRELDYFVELRTAPQAQAEMQRFANRIGACL